MAQPSTHFPSFDLAATLEDLRSVFFGCWRFRWHAIALAWGLSLAGWASVALMPDVYRASARVYVDTQGTLRPLLQGLAVNADVMAEVAMMERAVKSRPNLERVLHEADPDIQAQDARSFEALVTRLATAIKVERDSSNVVRISYDNADPRMALAVVTGILNSFVEGLLGDSRADSSLAEEFLVDKLKEYETRLNEAENRLAEFKRKNVGLMPGQNSAGYYDNLQTELTVLQGIEGKLRVARNRRAELQRQLEGEEPVFGLVPLDSKGAPATSPQERQIAQFEQQLANLRLKYTDTHPEVVAIRKTLEELRAEKEAAAKVSAAQPRTYSPLDLNPIYQQMKLQLSNVEVELAQLQTEYASQGAVVAGLRRKVDVIPAVEAELKRLTRDHDVNKTQYEELLRRVESARLSGDAEQSRSNVAFRVVDPAAVPSRPEGPNRPLLLTGVLLLALLAGIGLAVVLNFTQPVFFSGKSIERRFGVPVLGAIRLGRSAEDMATVRQNFRLLVGSLGALFVCYGVILVVGSTLAVAVTGVAGGSVAP